MQAAWDAAHAMIGARFRLHGRDADSGLDCVGVIVAAYAAVGVRIAAPDDYPLRGWSATRASAWLDRCGQRGALFPGGVVLIAQPAAQIHLGLWSGDSVIHAHAGLRRVVRTPWTLPVETPCWHPIDTGDARWPR